MGPCKAGIRAYLSFNFNDCPQVGRVEIVN